MAPLSAITAMSAGLEMSVSQGKCLNIYCMMQHDLTGVCCFLFGRHASVTTREVGDDSSRLRQLQRVSSETAMIDYRTHRGEQ